jgi:soluble cytochrome b562
MRKLRHCCSVLLFAAGAAWSAEVEMDTDWMKAIEDANKNLSSDIALKNTKGALTDTKELEEMFVKVEGFFADKGDAHEAVELTKKSLELTRDIAQSVQAGDFDKATNSATTLSRTCRSCHTFYKKS